MPCAKLSTASHAKPKTAERLDESQRTNWAVPFGRNKDFVGRELILAQLLEKIPPSKDEDDCQRTAIEGLGGVGKTQLALEAAFRVREKYLDCSVFWVPANDSASFENAYSEIGQQLKIEGINEDKADVKLLVKTALSQITGNWLLIIDNADDAELLFGTTGATPLCDYIPFNRKGSILFTTRNHVVVRKLDIPRTNVICATKLSRPEAIELLHRHLDTAQMSDSESTTELLDFLVDLPLAIKQASAYIDQTRITTTQYLEHCRSSDEHLIELLSKDFEDRARYKDIRNPVATTWLISFRHISRDSQLAAQYLKFMSFLAEKAIPKSLLPPGNGQLKSYEAIGTLKAYAFISERAGQKSYDIHRLVGLAMRNWLAKEGELQASVTTIIQRLDEVFPFPEHENKVVWVDYLPHALTALEFQRHSTDEVAESRLLYNVAESIFLLGKYQAAEELYQQTFELRIKMLGVEHPDTLTCMSNLANVLRSRGKYEEAETMHRQVLELRTKVLNAEHTATLTSINNLARVLDCQGKYEEAETIHRQALELRTKVLGIDHLSTLNSMNNLALVLNSQGKYEEAETMHRWILKLRTKALGADHSSTLTSVNNLALVLNDQRKYKEAEIMHRQVHKLWTELLGEEHPDTLTSTNNLALILNNQGKRQEAETMHRQVLKLGAKVLSIEHPSMLTSMDNLANVLHDRGKDEEAKTIYRQALKLRIKVLGVEHPDTLISMNNLANVLYVQGNYEEAEIIHRQAFELRTKVLGVKHPFTLTSRDHLVSVLRSQGKYDEANIIPTSYGRTMELNRSITLGL